MKTFHATFLVLLVAGSAGAFAACAENTVTEPGGGGSGGSGGDASTGGKDSTVDGPSSGGDDDVRVPPRDAGADRAVDARTDARTDASDASDAARGDAEAGPTQDAEAGIVDGGSDAPLAPPGSPCTTINEQQSQACGYCGEQLRVCLPGSDGGGLVWQPWGSCFGEVDGGCAPGTQTTGACGRCGTQSLVCQSDCRFSAGACLNQGVCNAGDVEFVSQLSCDGGGRSRTCSNACAWGQFGACEAPPPTDVIDIPSTVGSTGTRVLPLVTPGIPGLRENFGGPPDCEESTFTTDVKYAYIRVHNPTAQSAVVTLWLSGSPTGSAFDSVMAAYPGATVPPADRGMCAAFNDDCSTSPCVGSGMSGLRGGDAQTIPAGGDIVIYAAPYSSNTPTDVQLNVRTDQLN